MPRFNLTGQVALVSGAASGMGRASALALAGHGADLLLADINLAGLERTAKEIEQLGRRAIAVRCDVSQPEEIRGLFERLDRDLGQIDFLANIAGESIMASPEEISLEAVEQVFRNLVLGRFYMCQEAG